MIVYIETGKSPKAKLLRGLGEGVFCAVNLGLLYLSVTCKRDISQNPLTGSFFFWRGGGGWRGVEL